ncbi:hemolymph lipopolysaccharide-binding protein-like [Ischnura elegans]|uniref:hemolymph lipopolysaccharide-binding protein-like n=1 Tax=Ischnura elegans TaxID=197161 RepID=UPI001ED89C7F|nr:hemolymph lipopolysaccharide-binding protein-like [Ischnura elegans]XP_046395334.1 hemolymph lipopolysaccharide-binding protein-like [Ischnura elegans]
MPKISKSLSIVLGLILLSFSQEASCSELNKTLSLVISSRRNQTGHLISQASVGSADGKVHDHWKLKIHQSNFEQGVMRSFQMTATFIAPPPLPADYELFPGVGYYKFHTTFANGFEDASLKCAQEGGHLAIINSEAEHQVVQVMFAKHPESTVKTVWAFVGFHDRKKEGEFYTIFGEPLQSTGFTRWSHPGQPDDAGKNEDCGTVHRNGGLNDYPCNGQAPFFCEYDLSWTEN